MFIRKWRYLLNLENARAEGRQEGLREANEREFAYTTYLEELNKDLQEKLASANEGVEILRRELDEKSFPKKMLVETLANELACYQKQADVAFYDCSEQETSTLLLEKAMVIKELTNLMAIGGDVYERAYQIYDFRNSGKEGYTLKDGKIVKIEQEETTVVCPFGEEPAAENTVKNSSGDEIAVGCPEVSGIPDRCENCHVVQEFCDEESFF